MRHIHAVCSDRFQISFRFLEVLDAAHIDIPLAHNVDGNRAVAENSFPEGLFYVNGKHVRQNIGMYFFFEDTALMYHFGAVERNRFVFYVDNLNPQNNKRDNRRTSEYFAFRRKIR